MPHLVWSRASTNDLRRLQSFLAQMSPSAAQSAVRAIRESLRTLEKHPEAGRPLPPPSTFREWIVPFGRSAYIVVYGVVSDAVRIYAVRHGREKHL